MKAQVRRSLEFAAGALRRLAGRVYESPAERRLQPWLKVCGDETLRVEYDLGPASVVFDVGGYQGQWASDIYARYRCRIHVFEPVPEFADRIRARFARNPDIEVHAFGLAGTTGRTALSLALDRSSTLRSEGETREIEVVGIGEFLAGHAVPRIDLMKINIEGGEYDLLDAMLGTGLTDRVQAFQIQFHDFVDRADERMADIQRRLSVTHRAAYQFPYVWESWLRRDDGPARSAEGLEQ
jgi:FkbM family methyltransferase